jgi:ABC-2 type transport system ATP-binding protein
MRHVRRATLALAATLLAVLPAAAHAEDVTVASFDGTKISARFTPADGLKPGQRAPVMMMTHGFGLTRETVESGSTDLGQVGAPSFRKDGYSTLTWDSRGFGRSGGEVSLDRPEIDGRDVSALIDYLATRKDVQLAGPGDPRVGMHGASYGGGIEWATAVNDRRVDAIAPAISWVSLTDALTRDARVKLGWGAALVGLGEPTALAVGALAPTGPELGAFPPELVKYVAEGTATGLASPAFQAYLSRSSFERLLGRVRAPALILQGTADTIFSPSQAVKMRALLRPSKVPVKMMWFCGGHGVCLTGNGLADRQEAQVLGWMDRWVKGEKKVKTGPAFEWTSDDGAARSAADFPLAPLPPITASGSGTLALAPGAAASGSAVAATPAPVGVDVSIPAPATATDVVGDPQLELRYAGTAVNGPAHIFAQLVDDTRNVVVGNQATPIPVTLDGASHTVQRSLEGVAMRMTPGSRYRLQLIADTTVYGVERALGTVRIERATITLPAGDAAATKAASVIEPAAPKPRGACRSKRVVTVSLGRHRLHRMVVRVNGKRVRAKRVEGNRVRVTLAGRGKGRYTVTVSARRRTGKRVSTTRRYRTCMSGAAYKARHQR